MIETRRQIVRATVLLIVSSVCFGSLSTFTTLAKRAGLSLLTAMTWRYMIAVIVLAIIGAKSIRSIRASQAARLILIGGVGQAFITYLSLKALDYLPVGPLAFLFYTYPAWVAVSAAVTGRERLTARHVSALAIAMIGIVVMVGTPATESLNPVGVAIALGVAFLYAIYLPVLHAVQTGLRADIATLYLLLGVFLSFLLADAITGGARIPSSTDQWVYVLILALVCTVAAFSTLIAGLRTLGPVRTSIISTVEPFFTALLGVLLLGEKLSKTTIIGGALVAVAVVTLQLAGGARDSDAARI